MVTRSPGFTDLSASRMMPEMKLATIFCRPIPIPTPTAPENTASAERLMPTAPRAIATATTISPIRIILTSSTWIDGVRSAERLIRLSAKLLAMLVSHSASDQQRAELDQEQRRQPQAAEHDRNRVQHLDRRLELAEDAQRRDRSMPTATPADDEGVADHRGDEPDDQPGQRQLGGDREQVAAARPGRCQHDRRAPAIISTANTAVGALPTSTRMNRRNGSGQPIASEVDIDLGADRRAGGEGDARGGQNQPELQIEPGRGDLRADRARAAKQEFGDLVQVHRQNLIAGSQSGKFDSNSGQNPTMAAPGAIDTTSRRSRVKARKTGHIAAIARNGLASNCGDDKDASASICTGILKVDFRRFMASLDSVSIAILLGAVLVMAGILSSLLALRFGAPLLLVFLFIGMLAGDAGPGQLSFDDVRTTYLVGSVALALILFDGGLRTRFQSIRAVLAPSMVLATVGVLVTALITAPVAKYALDLNWTESLLVGAVVASTDAAAVFLLVHTQGLRLRPRVGATLEAESGTNDPFAIFLTLVLVEFISIGEGSACAYRAGIHPRGRARHHRRRGRRPPRGAGAESRGAAAGAARAVRRHRRAGDLRRGADRRTARDFSRSISPASSSATGRPARTIRW